MDRWVLTDQARSMLASLAVALALFLLVLPALAVLHELAVVATASLLRSIASWAPLRQLLMGLPLDPIYTRAALETIGKIKVAGVSVAPPFGDWLHALAPGWFAPSEASGGAWASALVRRGSTLAARGLAAFGGHVAVLSLGIGLMRLGMHQGGGILRSVLRPGRGGWLLFLGLLVQLQVAVKVLGGPPSLRDLEMVGVSFALGALFPSLTNRRLAVSGLEGALPGPLLSALLGLMVLLLAYMVSMAVVRGAVVVGGGVRLVWRLGGAVFSRERCPRVAAVGAALLAVSWLGVDVAEAEPSTVEVAGSGYSFTYLVNGVPQVIRGMGYNPVYAQLGRRERASLYDRDFAMMRQAGVNTVFGWVDAEFDELLLDKASEYGLGVAMPYHLYSNLDYSQPEVRERVRDAVLSWVQAYKDHPALRMWSIGNEVLHKMVHPSWVNVVDSLDRQRLARAFARFYVELIDMVHEADPNHPVLLRDAEDGYVRWIREALQEAGGARPWFIYGVNVYTSRLDPIVDNWPAYGLGVPLLVSEFAPGGLGPEDRPDGYLEMWQAIRRNPGWTLGGVVYVWTTAGPEEVDRAFGLVDAAGNPVDGSLAQIAQMFLEDEAEPVAAP